MTGSPCSHLSCTLRAELVRLHFLRNAAVDEVWSHPPQRHLADLTHATLFNLIHRDQVLLLELGRARIHITGGSVLKMDLKKTMDGRAKVRADIVPHYSVYSSINFEVPISSSPHLRLHRPIHGRVVFTFVIVGGSLVFQATATRKSHSHCTAEQSR